MVDPNLGATKWANGMNGSLAAFKAGVAGVTENPAQKAIAAQDKAARNYQQAISSGRWAQQLGKTTLESWKQAMNTTGADRIQSGVRKGQPKYQAFAQSFYPIMAQASAQAKSMPNNSTADALGRVAVVIQAAKQWAGKS